MYRLFVAITMPESTLDHLQRISSDVAGARWLRPEQIHLTLRFIGEVDGAMFRDIGEALFEIDIEPFEVSLEGVGVFPARKDPRILWVGMSKTEPLMHLQKKIESVLVRAGVKPDGRRFTPHVSIARLRDIRMSKVADFIARNSMFKAEPFTVNNFCLVSSHLGSEGASYQIEELYLLPRLENKSE